MNRLLATAAQANPDTLNHLLAYTSEDRSQARVSSHNTEFVLMYIFELIGENPNPIEYVLYARRVLDVIVEVENWSKSIALLKEICTMIDNVNRMSLARYLMQPYLSTTTSIDIQVEGEGTINALFIEKIRKIFGDENEKQKYRLEKGSYQYSRSFSLELTVLHEVVRGLLSKFVEVSQNPPKKE